METGDIQIKNAIVHIMDTSLGMAVYSDVELDYGSDFSDFMKNHIARVYNSDDLKQCRRLRGGRTDTGGHRGKAGFHFHEQGDERKIV